MARKNILKVTNYYNEDTFKQMLSMQRKDSNLSEGFLSQCIAALLACRDHNKSSKEIFKMEALLSNTGIEFEDIRSAKHNVSEKSYTYYTSQPDFICGDPEHAVKIFNELMCPI